MNRARQVISAALVLALVSIGATSAQAQRTNRMSDRQVDALIRRVENSTDRFRQSAAFALDRSRYNGTASEDEMNRFIQSFEQATDQLRDRFTRRSSASADVENVLRQAAFIEQFVISNRLGGRVQSDWALVRTDLDALARAYNVRWNWNQAGTVPGRPGYGSQRAYRVTDQQLDTLIRRIETRTDTFRASLGRALDRTRYDGTRTEDDINRFVRDFEQATDTLRARFGSRTSVAGDVEGVLRQAALIDSFVTRNRLNRRATDDWALLRTDLNELASTYSVAWNWDNTNTLPGGPVNTFPGGTRAANRLTGTFRLERTQSEDPRAVAERAVVNLPAGQRQRVYDRLVERLESPDMLAIERRGSQVTIASTRAPQTTFDADGRERAEQLPNGMQARVSAILTGDRLVVRSTGDRENDFTVTFDPTNDGRGLRVTREIWSDRLGANPIVVQNTYARTSETADVNVYTGGGYTAGSPTIGTSGSGDFVIANGTTLIATLNNQLGTQTSQDNDRFTMTVREPAQFAGSVIEGHISGIDRSGRVSGRSRLTFSFDRIRTRDGRTYDFAGWVESVRTPTGETVSVDNEGTVRDGNQTNRTVQRAAIGTAVGAIIGAIAGGGKGAAIGAVVGAGAGAGSVYVQGRDDLELQTGTELTIRASSPNR